MMESKSNLPFMNRNNRTKKPQNTCDLSTYILGFFNRSKYINLTLVHRIKRF